MRNVDRAETYATMRATDARSWDDLPLDIWMETARRLADRHPVAWWFEEGDRHSIAYLGLLRAQRTWRPDRRNRPLSWLYRCVWGELMEECRGPRYRERHISLADVALEEVPDHSSIDAYVRVLDAEQARDQLRRVYLSRTERAVLLLMADGWTCRMIARALGISQQRVHQAARMARKRARS